MKPAFYVYNLSLLQNKENHPFVCFSGEKKQVRESII
jgi:hypothetical protein